MTNRPIRVLLADDSPTVRQALCSILRAESDIEVVGEARDGSEAVAKTVKLRPDLVLMDVHMPVADGLHATRRIMAEAPTPIIVVSGSTRTSDVELSLSATRAGALMAIAKPRPGEMKGSAPFGRHLVEMVRAMAGVKVVRKWGMAPSRRKERPVLRRRPGAAPRIVAVGASTGGPAALCEILSGLDPSFPVPILVVQHIAEGFTVGFTEWLAGETRLQVRIARSGERPQPGVVHVAPDDRHLGVDRGELLVTPSTPPVAGFRPSATVLFRGVAEVYGKAAAALVLSGMGDDGLEGLRALRHRGGFVMAQDEESSIVYGMAREAAREGLTDVELPLGDIAGFLTELTSPEGLP